MDKEIKTDLFGAVNANREEYLRDREQAALARQEIRQQLKQEKLEIKEQKIKVLKKSIIIVAVATAVAIPIVSNAVDEIKRHIGSKYAYETFVDEGVFPDEFKAYESDIHQTVVVEYKGADGEKFERPLQDIGAYIIDTGVDVSENGYEEIYSAALVGAGFSESAVEGSLGISDDELKADQLNCYNMMQQLDKGMGRSN